MLGMKLGAYLKEHGQTVDAFAATMGRSKWGVRKWVYGQRMPRARDIEIINEVTGGKVTLGDFTGTVAKKITALVPAGDAA